MFSNTLFGGVGQSYDRGADLEIKAEVIPATGVRDALPGWVDTCSLSQSRQWAGRL